LLKGIPITIASTFLVKPSIFFAWVSTVWVLNGLSMGLNWVY